MLLKNSVEKNPSELRNLSQYMVLFMMPEKGSGVFKSLLAKLSLDSAASLSNKKVHINTNVLLWLQLSKEMENRARVVLLCKAFGSDS